MAIPLIDKIKQAIENHSEDNRFLNEVYATIEAYENDIAGYDFKGDPITYSALHDELEAASKKRNEKNYMTSDQLRKRYADWK